MSTVTHGDLTSALVALRETMELLRTHNAEVLVQINDFLAGEVVEIDSRRGEVMTTTELRKAKP